MRRILLSIVFLITVNMAFAQTANVTKYTTPLAGTVVFSDIDDKYSAQVFSLEAPNPDGDAEKQRLNAAKAKVATLFPRTVGKTQKKTTAAAAPVVTIGFLCDSFTGVPPDNYMAISKGDKAISVVNSTIAILDGKTGQMTDRTTLKAFSKTVGLNGFNDNRYDPKVIYDPEADRYISVMLNSRDAGNYIVIGFSQSNDPEGTWAFYKFYGNYNNDTTWFDYPTIAITKDEFFLTGNKIKFAASWELGFSESVIYQIDKQRGYDGDTALTYQIWDGIKYGGKAIRNLFPVKSSWKTEGPEQYFLSNRNFDNQNDSIFLFRLPDVISSGNKTLDIKVLKAPKSYGMPPNGRQPDTSVTLATNDARVLGAIRVDNEIQFVSTSVHPVNGSAAIYHGIIKDFASSSPSITHNEFITVDTLDFGYPNITFAGNSWGLNQTLISFNYTGPNDFPGLAALMFDGSQYSDIVRVKEGFASIKVIGGKAQRWGDYTGAQIDWNAYGSVWIEGIYGRADNLYGNWMARINSPLLNVKEQKKDNNIKVYPNPTTQVINITFELPKSGVVKYVIYDVQGRVVDNVLEQQCKSGKNLMRINVGNLPTGNYVLKAFDTDGSNVMVKNFMKQ